MRICKYDIHSLQGSCMVELSPVGCDHIGCNRKAGSGLELAHDFSAGETCLRSARIFYISQYIFHILAQVNGFCQAPCAVRVNVDTAIWELFFQCADRIHLVSTLKYTTF